MKAQIDQDEWWPVYSIDIDPERWIGGKTIDLPDEIILRHHRIMSEFSELQRELRVFYDKQEL